MVRVFSILTIKLITPLKSIVIFSIGFLYFGKDNVFNYLKRGMSGINDVKHQVCCSTSQEDQYIDDHGASS